LGAQVAARATVPAPNPGMPRPGFHYVVDYGAVLVVFTASTER
jgi:hypothetical protein